MHQLGRKLRNNTFDKESACKTSLIARIEMTKQSVLPVARLLRAYAVAMTLEFQVNNFLKLL